jgi:hypothetical protein
LNRQTWFRAGPALAGPNSQAPHRRLSDEVHHVRCIESSERYRELAKGCRRLAAIGFSNETQSHFLRMAEHYSTLTEAEEAADIGVLD